VRQSQLGDKECLNQLVKLARERLRVYVYRLVLDEDSTQDIVQESMLEMFKILRKLKKVELFWSWLYGIALNKVHRHYRDQRHYRKRPESGYGSGQLGEQEGIEKILSRELRQIVSTAMRQLKTEYRAILTMRCYDEMAYSEIAESMGCSEFAAKMLFLRAKRSLQRQLSRRGLGKGALLTALVLFGKMTAPSEAAAAKVAVTAGSLKVGAGVSAAVTASSKAVILPLAAAGIVGVGTIVATTSGPEGSTAAPAEREVRISQREAAATEAENKIDEYWYYYPSKAAGAVMMRLMQRGRCVVRQNESGNYYFHKRDNNIHIENYRPWNEDLGVWRLPTDSLKMREFITQIEGRGYETAYVPAKWDGLLVIARRDTKGNGGHMQTTYQYNVLDEEYFRYNLPASATIMDNRDAMHKRGWTYFRISGEVDGKEVTGCGRIPFVYAASQQHWPWIRVRIGGEEFIDKDFSGLGRPWMGLHTIDIVRRDAAEKEIPFETALRNNESKGQVILTHGTYKGIYTIDMEKDVVERIIYSGEKEGEIIFDYLQEIGEVASEFAAPRGRSRRFSLCDF
jgi:RNA polymerase sigma-70 factor (ECF subfamily)